MSQSEAERRLDVARVTIQEWIAQFKAHGALAFSKIEHNAGCSEELKLNAVMEYLAGGISQNEVAAKYGLRTKKELQEWIKVYNSGIDFSHKMSGGRLMLCNNFSGDTRSTLLHMLCNLELMPQSLDNVY